MSLSHFLIEISGIPREYTGRAHFACDGGFTIGGIGWTYLLNLVVNPENSMGTRYNPSILTFDEKIFQRVPKVFLIALFINCVLVVASVVLFYLSRETYNKNFQKTDSAGCTTYREVVSNWRVWAVIVVFFLNMLVDLHLNVLWKVEVNGRSGLDDPGFLNYIFAPLFVLCSGVFKFFASWAYDKLGIFKCMTSMNIMVFILLLVSGSIETPAVFLTFYFLTIVLQSSIFSFMAPLVIGFTGAEFFEVKFGFMLAGQSVASGLWKGLLAMKLKNNFYALMAAPLASLCLVFVLNNFKNVSKAKKKDVELASKPISDGGQQEKPVDPIIESDLDYIGA